MLKSVHIDKVGLDSLYVKAKRNTQGEIDWLEYIKVNAADVQMRLLQRVSKVIRLKNLLLHGK